MGLGIVKECEYCVFWDEEYGCLNRVIWESECVLKIKEEKHDERVGKGNEDSEHRAYQG